MTAFANWWFCWLFFLALDLLQFLEFEFTGSFWVAGIFCLFDSLLPHPSYLTVCTFFYLTPWIPSLEPGLLSFMLHLNNENLRFSKRTSGYLVFRTRSWGWICFLHLPREARSVLNLKLMSSNWVSMQPSLTSSLLSQGVGEFYLWTQLISLALFWITGNTFSPLSIANACFHTWTPELRPHQALPILQLVCSSWLGLYCVF